jgi:hypothetical protein
MIFGQFFNHKKMKVKFLFLLFCLPISFIYAQDLTDVVRFSREDLMGTARFTGMAGAFSSLGGDLSALKLNPAGSSVFLTNHASGTLNLNIKNNDVNFTDGFTDETETTFDLNQLGIVFVFAANNEDVTLSKYAYGFTYEQVADYDNSYVARGNNNQSIDQFFVDSANGIPLDLLTPLNGESIADLYTFLGETEGVTAQNALLGFQSFVIDPVNPDDFNNMDYISNVTANQFLQDYFIQEDGYNGKFSFNASLELNKRFYFGLNLNAHYMEYDRFTSFFESNSDPTSEINSIRFDNRLRTRANAFSFQLGSIVKITDQFRAALSYNSPTWYDVSDETSQFIRTGSDEYGPASVNPRVLNVFPDYNYRTASKWTAGLSYIFKGRGLLSIDYSLQDYSNAKFTTNSLEFLNTDIEQNLTSAANLNIGGEYVFKQFKFRGGYFLQETPYEDDFIQGDLEGFSLGLGYTIKNVNIDLAYSLASLDRNDRLYQTGLNQTAQIDSNISNLFLTVSLGF